MKYLLLGMLLFSTMTIAADSKKVNSSNSKKMSELGKIDDKTLDLAPADKNKERVDETALYAKPKKANLQFSCKTNDGHELKQGEVGYDECLQQVKNDKNNPHKPNADIKVKIGE